MMISWVILTMAMMGGDMPQESIEALNKRCYDARADYWDRMPFANFLPAAIVRAHHPGSGFRALDIGSGTGVLAAWLAQNGYEVLCLDPSNEMVRRTRALGLPTEQKTIQEFSSTTKFDLILAILSLIHVPKKEMPAQISKIAGMLQPQGVFALAMIAGHGEGLGETGGGYPRFFAYYSREEILALVSNDFTLLAEHATGGSINYLVFIFTRKSF